MSELHRKLKNLVKRWRSRATREEKLAERMFKRNAHASAEKSIGISIGYRTAANELDRLLLETFTIRKS